MEQDYRDHFTKYTKYGLTRREMDVACLVTEGLTNKEIAQKLFVEEKTVKFHMCNIFKKFGVKGRTKIAVMLLRQRGRKNVRLRLGGVGL